MLAKVGDKIKVTQCSFDNVWYKDHIGEEFIVEEVIERVNGESKGYYMVEDNTNCGINDTDCVVVKGESVKTSLKDMLQNGVRVKCRNGLMHTYVDGYFTNINVTGDGLNYLSEVESWSDDLRYYKNTGLENEWDVMEIYAKVNIYDYFNNKIKGRVIWQREEKSESEKQLEILQQQIESLTQQAIKLGEQIKMEKQ